MMLHLIDEIVEDVVDLPRNISPEPLKLAIDSMQKSLEKVPLSRIQESKYKLLVNVFLG